MWVFHLFVIDLGLTSSLELPVLTHLESLQAKWEGLQLHVDGHFLIGELMSDMLENPVGVRVSLGLDPPIWSWLWPAEIFLPTKIPKCPTCTYH